MHTQSIESKAAWHGSRANHFSEQSTPSGRESGGLHPLSAGEAPASSFEGYDLYEDCFGKPMVEIPMDIEMAAEEFAMREAYGRWAA